MLVELKDDRVETWQETIILAREPNSIIINNSKGETVLEIRGSNVQLAFPESSLSSDHEIDSNLMDLARTLKRFICSTHMGRLSPGVNFADTLRVQQID